MITAIELENFKGIGKRQRIALAPLTLLFGANSAGKSTILHALILAREVLDHGEADVDRTLLGGEAVNLGGFEQYVHNHDSTSVVRMRLEFSVPGGLDLDRRIPDAGFILPDIDDEIDGAWVELALGTTWSPAGAQIRASALQIGIQGWREAMFELQPQRLGRPDSRLELRVNPEHGYFAGHVPQLEELFTDAGAVPTKQGQWELALHPHGFGALPDFTRPLQLLRLGSDERPDSDDQVETLLTVLIGGTLRCLQGLLDSALYVGPLRVVPPRNFSPDLTQSRGRWPTGLGAWDALSKHQWLVDDVNRTLVSLSVEYQLAYQEVTVIANDARREPGEEWMLRDSRNRDDAVERGELGTTKRRRELRLTLLDRHRRSLALHDVGVGLSQLIPVLAGCFEGKRGPMLVEQPELHIHPSLQVGLGDLFIRTSAHRQLIVETHSEHIVLRVLRRIRETTEAALHATAPSFAAERLSVLYVESNAVSGSRVQSLRVDASGEFSDRWPTGFFEERNEELF